MSLEEIDYLFAPEARAASGPMSSGTEPVSVSVSGVESEVEIREDGFKNSQEE